MARRANEGQEEIDSHSDVGLVNIFSQSQYHLKTVEPTADVPQCFVNEPLMRDALECRTGTKLAIDDAIWPWMVEYAAQVIHSMQLSKVDGKSARQRIRGNPSFPEIFEFGEN